MLDVYIPLRERGGEGEREREREITQNDQPIYHLYLFLWPGVLAIKSFNNDIRITSLI